MVRDALGSSFADGVRLQRLAHSGAVIGANPTIGAAAAGEVPAIRPTIIEQCDSFSDSPDTVDLVLVNGGINDVGVARILNPFDRVPSLDSRIERACYDDMLLLLRKIANRFSKPTCRILVTGYYPIVSRHSDPLGVHRFLSVFGIKAPTFLANSDAILGPVIDRCEKFLLESTSHFQRAVAVTRDPRISFVSSAFTDENAIFVPGTTCLFGLDIDELLSPEDPVANERKVQCDIAHGDPLDLPARELCYRASAGHPNQAGAIKYKTQILAAFQGKP
jgi:hypothetical protein